MNKNILHKILRFWWLLWYYLIAYHLPSSNIPIIGPFSRWFRSYVCRHLFNVGDNCNIQRNVYFGIGMSISIGNASGIGTNCQIYNTILNIGNNVMMGPDVMIMGGGHNYRLTDVPMAQQ